MEVERCNAGLNVHFMALKDLEAILEIEGTAPPPAAGRQSRPFRRTAVEIRQFSLEPPWHGPEFAAARAKKGAVLVAEYNEEIVGFSVCGEQTNCVRKRKRMLSSVHLRKLAVPRRPPGHQVMEGLLHMHAQVMAEQGFRQLVIHVDAQDAWARRRLECFRFTLLCTRRMPQDPEMVCLYVRSLR